MQPYIKLLKTQAMIVLQYRAQALAGAFTQAAFGLMRVYMIIALYKSAPNQALTLSEAVSYIWLTQILLTFIAWGPDPLVSAMVRDGTLAYEMIRPLRLSIAWWMRSLAFRGINPIMRGIPIIVLALLLPEPMRLQLPFTDFTHFGTIITWILSVACTFIMGWLLAGALNNLTNILVVRWMSDEGLVRIFPIAMLFFGGLILPLPLFPEGVQYVLMKLPFSGLMDIPSRIFSGQIRGLETLYVIGHQMFWVVTMMLLNDFLLQNRLKHAEIQGG